MSFRTQAWQDNEAVFLSDFGEPGTVDTVDGEVLNIIFVREESTDLALMEPGYADTENFRTSLTQYPQPKPSDRITDENDIVWIVEPGARIAEKMWSIPVKSDRRLRT